MVSVLRPNAHSFEMVKETNHSWNYIVVLEIDFSLERGLWILEFGIYLDFGYWILEFAP